MGIEKVRRRMVGKGGFETSEVGSFAVVDVTSEVTIADLKGAGRWRGIATINSGDSTVTVSAAAVASGYTPFVSLGRTTVASHRDIVLSVNSIVDNTSFMAVASKATVDDQEIVYVVIGG